MSDFWCPLPWIHQFVQTDGIKTCCQGTLIEQTSVAEFSNTNLVKEVKQSILANRVHKNCTGCAKLEQQGFASTRTEAVDHYKHYNASNIPDQTEYLDLRYSNLCNFSCRTCEPAFSSSIVTEVHTNPRLARWYAVDNKRNSYDRIVGDLDKLLPRINRINFTGGEPLLIKENLRIIEKIPNKDCQILITTNASVINPLWLESLKKFKDVHWTISVDGIDKTAEYIRYGSKWGQIDKNIRSIISTGHSVAFNTVLSAYSVLDVDRLVTYFIKLKKITKTPLEHWFHLCTWPEFLSPNVLTGELNNIAITKLKLAADLLSTQIDNPPAARDTLLAAIKLLNSTIGDVDKFNKFTSELDTLRGQDFYQLIIKEPDMYENRIKHLKESHRVLDDKINAHEREHPGTESQLVHDWKKQKLQLKDEIAKLESLQGKKE